ncbi:LrgB family protein [Membranihabitans marinus]|uniref:LrgB family protein n=1 Tax=Membranihabitans marinus TaxID=1227546 RepID=UPI0021D44E6C|nr:LrgB family protein [Membranihabitans marinus]
MITVITILLFLMARRLYKRWSLILFIPVFFAIMGTIITLKATETPFTTYFHESRFLTFLLGPTVVALGTLLYKQLHSIVKNIYPFLLSIFSSCCISLLLIVAIGRWLDFPTTIIATLLPMGITSPIAIEVTQNLNGDPTVTSVLVIAVGLFGNMFAPILLRYMGIQHFPAMGTAIGTASHGIGTARAIEISDETGIYSGLAMVFNAIFTVIMAPIIWELFF